MNLEQIALLAYVGIAIVGSGIYFEVVECDFEDAPEIIFGAIFWPLGVALALVVGALWCISWVGRGPGKLVKYLINRKDIPEARVVRE